MKCGPELSMYFANPDRTTVVGGEVYDLARNSGIEQVESEKNRTIRNINTAKRENAATRHKAEKC